MTHSDDSHQPTERDRAITRYVDGEMAAAEREAFERELASDDALRAAVGATRELRELFEPGRAEVPAVVAPGFRDRVLASLPDSVERDPVEAPAASDAPYAAGLAEVHRWAFRLTAAALLLLSLGLLSYFGLLEPTDTGRLEASPDQIDAKMQELDAILRRAADEVRRR